MKILLVEPNYKNKYPPMGLMKISTYHKNRGDEVTFFKGVMDTIQFLKEQYDRVYITSLFTFYYNQTVKTIQSYEKLISPEKIYIGGIMVSLMKDRIKNDIDDRVTILTGLLTDSHVLGLNDSVNIDILPLDYAILDDIVYKYPEGDNYFAYISRGCTNKCSFCAVPILEPEFCMTNNIIHQVKTISQNFGEKKNLLLLDNNILSFSEQELEQIISDIQELGFDKKTKFFRELPLKQFMGKLHKYENGKVATKNVLNETLSYLKEKEKIKKSKIYQEKYMEIMSKLESSDDKLQILFDYEDELIEILDFYHHPVGSRRAVDFNQGMDARQLTDEKMKILSRIPIEPFRLAFDRIEYKDIYSKALKIAAKYEVKSFSNYILYNCDDKPEELWERLKINVDLAKELDVKIFSFPMKYAPIDRIDRKYVGKFWNRQYLKNIYAILNVTKGIVADGESFFYKAFGRNIDEFYMILSMPKEFVTYRAYFEENGLAFEWQEKFLRLSLEERDELLEVLSEEKTTQNSRLVELLGYYSIKKKRRDKMYRNYEYKEVDIQDLLLDEENPRFASSILVKESASQIGQDTIVEHLLRYSNVIELANRINDVGELHGSEIITCIQKGDKYVVLEGNRRTCACKLLLDRTLIPEQYKNKITFITERTKANITKVMVTIYPDRESVQPYLSDRHITGVKKWSALEKNNYYMNLFYQYNDVEDVKKHTSDSTAVVTKSIIKYQFFMDVFDILKSKYQDLEIEKIDYLPMVDRFMETLVGNDEEVGLKLQLDSERLIYICLPEKKEIYDSILLKVGEAFLIRKEKRLCEKGEESKIVSSEIYAKRDQKQLILDDVRIPGLYKLIQEYKGNSETSPSNAGNTNKSNDDQMSDPSSGIKENDDNKTTESGDGSSKKDKGEDNGQTPGGKNSDPEHKNENKQNGDNSNWKGAGGNKNLPYFFQGLNYQNLDPNDSDSHGISRVCKEIQLFSNRKLVNDFPMAAAFLMRTIIEHSLIYYSKKHKIQGQDKYIWGDISNNNGAMKLSSIINIYKRNLTNYITNQNMQEYFLDLFQDYDKEVNPLNWVVHRPEQYQLPAKDLIDLPRKGLLSLINFLIS